MIHKPSSKILIRFTFVWLLPSRFSWKIQGLISFSGKTYSSDRTKYQNYNIWIYTCLVAQLTDARVVSDVVKVYVKFQNNTFLTLNLGASGHHGIWLWTSNRSVLIEAESVLFLLCIGLIQNNGTETQWTPFRRRHFEAFSWMKRFLFHPNFIGLCS